LQVPLFDAPVGVLVGRADGGADVHVPGDRAIGVGLSLEPGDEPGPGAVALPAPEQVAAPVPGSLAFRHITAGSNGPGPPSYAVYQLPSRPHRRPARFTPCGSNGSSRAHWLFVRYPRSQSVIIHGRDPLPQQTLAGPVACL
jgi:hypothetical protein